MYNSNINRPRTPPISRIATTSRKSLPIISDKRKSESREYSPGFNRMKRLMSEYYYHDLPTTAIDGGNSSLFSRLATRNSRLLISTANSRQRKIDTDAERLVKRRNTEAPEATISRTTPMRSGSKCSSRQGGSKCSSRQGRRDDTLLKQLPFYNKSAAACDNFKSRLGSVRDYLPPKLPNKNSLNPFTRYSIQSNTESLTPLNKDSLTPLNKDSLTPLNKDSLTPLNKDSLTPLNKDSLTPLNKDSLTPLNKDSLTPLNKDSLTPLNKDSLTPLNKDSITPLNKDSLTPNKDSLTPSNKDSLTLSHKETMTNDTNKKYHSTTDLRSPSNMDLRSPSNMDLRSPSNMDLRSPSNMDLSSTSNKDLRSTSNMDLRSPSNKDLRSTSNMDLRSPSNMDLRSPTNMYRSSSSNNFRSNYEHQPFNSSSKFTTGYLRKFMELRYPANVSSHMTQDSGSNKDEASSPQESTEYEESEGIDDSQNSFATGEIKLLKSAFEGYPPTIYFDYCSKGSDNCSLPTKRTFGRVAEVAISRRNLYFSHSSCVHEYNCVVNTLTLNGLVNLGRKTNSNKWTVLWGGQFKPERIRDFHQFQKTNHFPLSWHLGRKDLTWTNLLRFKRRVYSLFSKQHLEAPYYAQASSLNIMPETYILPEDYKNFNLDREKEFLSYIFKPVGSSCGHGIRLTTSDCKFIHKRTSGIVQKYVINPMLINGYKFDLRLYVVVSSLDPLRIYLYDEGLVRLATEKYAIRKNSLKRTCKRRRMHLTNYSVNKKSLAYKKNFDGGSSPLSTMASSCDVDFVKREDISASSDESEVASDVESNCVNVQSSEGLPSKLSLADLKNFITTEVYDDLMLKIHDLIVKSIISVEPTLVSAMHRGSNLNTIRGSLDGYRHCQQCFEIFGFDILIQDDYKPWLLEVNISPSLSSSSPLDKRIKTMLMADVFTLIGLQVFDYKDPSLCELGTNLLSENQQREFQTPDLKREFQTPDLKREFQTPDLKREFQRPDLKRGSIHRGTLTSSISTRRKESFDNAFSPFDWRIITETFDEYMRRGRFKRLYPPSQDDDDMWLFYLGLFETRRYTNELLHRWWTKMGGYTYV